MTIDRSGEYWTGSSGADLDEYLRDLTAESYRADRFVHARCTCGHAHFALMFDADEGCAQRRCAKCGETHLICDSEASWAAADPEEAACPCDNETFEIAVGFSHRKNGAVRWITVGIRCTACGVLGSPVDWKIDYSPTNQLYDQV